MGTSKEKLKQTLNVIVVACTKSGVIGRGNSLPWQYPEDLKFFKRLTTGHVIIMGRKTFGSFKSNTGLPNRINRVVSTTVSKTGEVEYYKTFEEALVPVEGKINFIIGGSTIYEYALEHNLVDIVVMTRIMEDHDGDKYFPKNRLTEYGFTHERKIQANMAFDIIQLSKGPYANSESLTKLVYPPRHEG
jgi:dihydrofolate reductase